LDLAELEMVVKNGYEDPQFIAVTGMFLCVPNLA